MFLAIAVTTAVPLKLEWVREQLSRSQGVIAEIVGGLRSDVLTLWVEC